MFKFTDDLQALKAHEKNAFIAMLPTGTDDARLFDELFKCLRLPEYFGRNWNALSDCLRDFHWLDQQKVILIHQDVPRISEFDLLQYLDVLREACKSWRPNEEHSFEVVFPSDSRPLIERIFADNTR